MNDKPTVFLSEKQIAKRVEELGEAITKDYEGKKLVCIAVLKGSVVFFSDLVRKIDLPIAIDFIGASSYGAETKSSGVVKTTLDVSISIENKHVLVVEDIVDTGLTLRFLMDSLRLRNPASLHLCALLLKPGRLDKPIPIDYLGFTIDDRFVVGYGLDASEQYRNLPYLAALPETDEKSAEPGAHPDHENEKKKEKK